MSYAGVTLGLIHGAQADALVMCTEAGRPHMRGLPDYKMPEVPETIAVCLQMARMVNPAVRCVGVSANTSSLDAAGTKAFLAKIVKETGLPVSVSPMHGGKRLVEQRRHL